MKAKAKLRQWANRLTEPPSLPPGARIVLGPSPQCRRRKRFKLKIRRKMAKESRRKNRGKR